MHATPAYLFSVLSLSKEAWSCVQAQMQHVTKNRFSCRANISARYQSNTL